ncbi:hypothetical protein P8V03_14270 [Clostridium sp. A1-XYC3]|uniref:Uncharacterized protein n=1 Tax=Clostridium tanneri TaxID=3037988 RepID=A0ABU4JVZ6_9CLOT|nr:hypothetical protein [Clostridium sp. A1-XYC3]MDW8802316.1 hypothetical protein [Clostridium sp. A1-XYC3]
MTGLTFKEQSDKDENMDQSVEKVTSDNDTSPESEAGTVLLAVSATIIMGILIFLFI